MILENEIKIKNYKCFNENGEGFNKILPINIIIGKNNSGKSSLIELIRFIVNDNVEIFDSYRNNTIPEVLISNILTENNVERVFQRNTSGGNIGGNHYEFGMRFIGSKIKFKLGAGNKREFIEINSPAPDYIKQQLEQLTNVVSIPLRGKTFCNISAERDITPELSSQEVSFKSNGSGATNFVQQIINKDNRDSRLIEDKLLLELNKIVEPDMAFKRILVQLNDDDLWEIYFIDNHDSRVALSKMGSGIKTVILVLLNLIVKPAIDGKNTNNYIFAFEELENNLHPSLQRKLYEYIKQYSKINKSYFFLTTHSNVVIDTFSTIKEAQLLHIKNNGNSSECSTVISYAKTKNIIEDLGLKASDILQTNGVIWVEGPSDRNYINGWLSLLNPELKEGLHYSIMFYGGRLLSNLSFDFKWLQKELIPLLKINRNAFVIIDRDGKGIKTELNKTKVRIGEEIGEKNCWVTKGREIENYLRDQTINSWLKNSHDISLKVNNDKNVKLEDIICNSGKDIKLKYNRNKTVFSSEIIEYMSLEDLEILDLKEKLKTLTEQIRIWNS